MYNAKLKMPPPTFESKIVSMDELEAKVSKLVRPVVFTNGVFDILHRGHVTYLDQAKSLGKSLVVAINSDASVKMLGKGDDRPINEQEDRAAVLAALESVDLVVIFNEKVPLEPLKRVKADIYVKGGDYSVDQLPEAKLVASWNGQTKLIEFEHQKSTTKLLEKIRKI